MASTQEILDQENAELKQQLEAMRGEYALLIGRFFSGFDLLMDVYRTNRQQHDILAKMQEALARQRAMVPGGGEGTE